jgi:hypothetical protein
MSPSLISTTVYFTPLHFTSFHLTSLYFDDLPLNFSLFITFLNLFLKLLGLQERFPKTSAGSWFQSWMVLFTKEYFPISVLIPSENFVFQPIMSEITGNEPHFLSTSYYLPPLMRALRLILLRAY